MMLPFSNTLLENSYLCQQVPNLGMMSSGGGCFLKKLAKMEVTRTKDRMGPSTVLEVTTTRWQAELVREVGIGVAVSSVFQCLKGPHCPWVCVFVFSGTELPARCQALF